MSFYNTAAGRRRRRHRCRRHETLGQGGVFMEKKERVDAWVKDRKSTRNLVQLVEALHPVAGCQAKATKLKRGLVYYLDRPPRALADMKASERREKLLSQRKQAETGLFLRLAR